MDRKWWTLIVVCVGTFMLLLDITIVNVALPKIQEDLHSSFADLQWVVDAYALTLAAFLLTAGSLADRLGRRAVWIGGLSLFTAASLLCGLAQDPTQLNLARGLQGVGGAAMFATSLALLAQAFHGNERGTAIGIWGATIGAAVAIGPLVGGVLVDGISWEAIFGVNVPIGVVAVALTLREIDESKDPEQGRIDVPGTVLFSGSLFCLVLGLIRGNPDGWSSTKIVLLLGAAAVLMLAFLVVEHRSDHPMLALELFAKPAFVGASVGAFVLSASMFAMFLYLTLYIQNVLGYDPLEAGLRFLPVTLLSFAVSPISGRLTERMPVRVLMGAGLLLVGAGLLLMRGLEPGDDWTAMLAGFLIAGGGIGLINPALASAAIGVVPPWQAGMGSGINSTFRQVGIATGIAGLGAVFQQRIDDRIAAVLGRVPAGLGDAVSFGQLNGTPAAVHRAGVDAFITGLNGILLLGAIVALVGAALAFALTRPGDFWRPPPAPQPA